MQDNWIVKTKGVLVAESPDFRRAIQLAVEAHKANRKNQVGVFALNGDCAVKVLESGSILIKPAYFLKVLL